MELAKMYHQRVQRPERVTSNGCCEPEYVLQEVTTGKKTSNRDSVERNVERKVRLGIWSNSEERQAQDVLFFFFLRCLLFHMKICGSITNQGLKKKCQTIWRKIFWGRMLPKRAGLAQSCLSGWPWVHHSCFSGSSLSASYQQTRCSTLAPGAGALAMRRGGQLGTPQAWVIFSTQNHLCYGQSYLDLQ